MSKKARGGEVGSRREKGKKKDEMRLKGHAARFKVGPRAASSCSITHESPASRQSTPSSHEPPFHTPFDPPQPLECLLGSRKDWHVNRDKLCDNRKQTRKPRKSERTKIESFILCLTFLVPRNAKQRMGNCHNPIFTPRIFSGVSTQNEAT
jgi:hypothetical protein